MAQPPRRFPPPWHADPMPGGYVVRDANGQTLAFVYARDNEDEARQAKVHPPPTGVHFPKAWKIATVHPNSAFVGGISA
jgi:hypothetical protein